MYPSRVAPRPSLSPRLDPVIYGSREEGPLALDHLSFLEANGYLLFDVLLTADEVAAIYAELDELARDPAVKNASSTIIEPRSEEIRSLFAVHETEGPLGDLARHPRIVAMARQILGSDVYVHQSRVNLKPGFEGAGFPWHSDFETWHTEDGMPRMRAFSISISLTENNEFNGPLMLVPTSHQTYVACVGETPEDHYKESLRWQESGTPDRDSLTALIESGGVISAKGKAGSAVLFDCNTMHGSVDNITPFPRSNVFLVYNSMENALVEPFCGRRPRPSFIASRDFTPV